ncbi:hypothetical protein BH10ACI4_BH10ACI4_28340 [soil metagenome]
MNVTDYRTAREYRFHFRQNSDIHGFRMWEITAEQVDQTIVAGPANLQWIGRPESAGQLAMQLGLSSDLVLYLTIPTAVVADFHQ